METDDLDRRLKYYGLRDYGTYFQAERVKELLRSLAESGSTSHSIVDVIEVHNLRLLLEDGLFGQETQDVTGQTVRQLIPRLKGIVARRCHSVQATRAC